MVSGMAQEGTVSFRMPDFADDTSSELERKARALSVMALVETISYLTLFYFWIISPNEAVKAVVGFFHGLIWLAFVAMTVIITPAIGWSWLYTALVVVTGPIGGLLVFVRIRRTPRAELVRRPSPPADPQPRAPQPGQA